MAATAACGSSPAPPGSNPESPISEFYRNRSILVTGATGFMGKVLVEKLLRSCSDLKSIYVLIRPKRGLGVEDRRQQLISAKVFDVIRAERPHLLRKVIAVEGDVTKPELGLSASAQETLQKHVSVVFNSAATVSFYEPLRTSVAINIEGTRRLVELCRGMRHLVSFIHVSTAYSISYRDDIKEDFYDPPYDSNEFVNIVNSLDDATLIPITPNLLRDHPNTYTLTKALAESLLVKIAKDLPVSIVRPSIVAAALREPFPGWIDNTNGPTGVFASGAKGILFTVLCNGDLVADFIAVDLCINLMVALAWQTANTAKPTLPKIYQITSGAQNPMYWQDLQNFLNKSYVENPCKGILWYPQLSFRSSKFIHNVCSIIQHNIPAVLIDAGARLMRKKPIMVNIQKRIHKATICTHYFTTRQWNFSDTNVQNFLKQLSPVDLQTFNFDIKQVLWKEYIEKYCEGIRMFVLEEGPEIDEKSRIRVRRLFILRRAIQIAFISLCLWLTVSQPLKSVACLLISWVLFAIQEVTRITRSLLLGFGNAVTTV